MRNWSRERIAWLSGFIEGEGCFHIRTTKRGDKSYRYVEITTVSTDRDSVEKCLDIVGYGSIYALPYTLSSGIKKVKYTYYVGCGEEASALLSAIYSFMGARRKAKIRECLDVWKKTPPKINIKTAFGESKDMKDWLKDPRCKVNRRTLRSRFNEKGWSFEESLTRDVRGRQAEA